MGIHSMHTTWGSPEIISTESHMNEKSTNLRILLFFSHFQCWYGWTLYWSYQYNWNFSRDIGSVFTWIVYFFTYTSIDHFVFDFSSSAKTYIAIGRNSILNQNYDTLNWKYKTKWDIAHFESKNHSVYLIRISYSILIDWIDVHHSTR